MLDRKPQKSKKCVWKKLTDLLTNPEGQLRHCYLNCKGYDTSCNAYSCNVKVILESKPNLENNIFYRRSEN